MAKFYVTCGPISEVRSADSAEQAATDALGKFFSSDRWVYQHNGFTNRIRRDYFAVEALLQLDAEIMVSERGIQRNDAGSFGTPEILDLWHSRMQVVHLRAMLGLSSGDPMAGSTFSIKREQG